MADEKTTKAAGKEAKARKAALDAAVTQIEREFGLGSVMRLGDDAVVPVEAISTGALSLDLALGVGGVPRGRIVEIFGPESSGKTTLVYHVIAQAQARGGVCAFVDAEHSIDPIYAKRIGVDTDELLVSQPDYGEQALEIVDVLVRSGAVDVVAVDSVAALTPRVELEGQMGEMQVGLQARLMSQALRKLAGNLNRATHDLPVHQPDPREDRGQLRQPRDPARRSGAQVLLVAATRHPPHRDPQGGHPGGRQPGAASRWSRTRSRPRSARPSSTSSTATGISKEGCLIDLGLEHDLVQKSGSFFSYGELRLGQGRNNSKQYLAENPELADEIEARVYEALEIERARRSRAGADRRGGRQGRGRTSVEAEEQERKAA